MAEVQRKTKDANTFRFKSFADRVSEIDIRQLALYHIGHENEELPEENETYFHQTLKKWMVLNLTEEYSKFSRKCMKIVTLPQLIHQKDFVVDMLLERLATATILSLQPLLELLYVLARDLREEFYPYFQRVLDRLICLLNTQDAEQLEWTLVCLAYLCKTLKPYLKKHIGELFHAMLPLLDEERYEEHVTNFAVECFSYIARDVRDYRKLLDFILEIIVHEQVESVQGCGRLLFEIIRGVKGQFHSGAADFLHFLFECVVDNENRKEEQAELLNNIVFCAVDEMLGFIYPQNINVCWSQLCEVGNNIATKLGMRLDYLIAIFLQIAQYKDGRYLAILDVLVPTILKMCDACMEKQSEQPLKLLAQLVSAILRSGSTQLTQLDTSRLLKKILTFKQRDIYAEFVLSIVSHPQFELLVLPTVLNYFELHQCDLASLELMAKIVLKKQPLARNATELKNWRMYPLHLKQTQTLQKISNKLLNLNLKEDEMDDHQREEQLLLLILAPHFNALPLERFQPCLEVAIQQMLNNLNDSKNINKTLIMLSLVLQTEIYLKFNLNSEFKLVIMRALICHSTNLHALGVLDQLLLQFLPNTSTVTQWTSLLTPLLSSHQPELRLTAAHCLQSLHKNAKDCPYKIFYAAALIEPNLHNYREQLLLLQQLHTAGELYRNCKCLHYKLDTIRFLLGMLYQTFKLVWEPLLQLIEEYAKALDLHEFWPIYRQKLEETIIAIDYTALKEEQPKDSEFDIIWHSAVLQELLPPTVSPRLNQQQLLTYRQLLWQRLPEFGTMVETKNRDLITFFLQFVQDEYRQQVETREYTWNLCDQKEKAPMLEMLIESDDDQTSCELTCRIYKKRRSAKSCNVVKQILQALQSQLRCFIGQPNPKSLYRTADMYSFYLDLLATPNASLQKLALDCVYTYKSNHVLPYKEHLYAICDEQRLKDALINFKLDTVSAEHRKSLMHILLRLLYGKMLIRGRQRQMSIQVRKSVILRFLGQCSADEIYWFLQMAFDKYKQYTSDSVQLEQVPTLVHECFKLEATYSPKKLQSVINLLELMRKEFGGLISPNCQLYMLKLLNFVGATCNEVLDVPSAVLHPKIHTIYRQLRNTALLSLCNFFTHLNEYTWTPVQVESVTSIFVWPSIERLPLECIHTPTPLLKLLLQWGEQPAHFSYLQQQQTAVDKDNSFSIFYYIIELLLNPKAKIDVRKPIMALIERLLEAAASKPDASELSIFASNALLLVQPFIKQILQRLHMNMKARGTNKTLDKRDLHILALVTPYVKEANTCNSLLQLLLPVLIAKKQQNTAEDVVPEIIITISNLIKNVENPQAYVLKVAPLFEQMQEVSARKLLCQLLTDIAKQCYKQAISTNEGVEIRLRETARIMFQLNAWDKRWVEQPDYDKRLDAFKEIKQLLPEGGVDLPLGVLIIYNCFYILRHDKDMGLRDNANEMLQEVMPTLVKQLGVQSQQCNYLINEVCLNLLRRALSRDLPSNDHVRQAAIRLLGVLARQCADAHAIFADLHLLADNKDVEVDFFENMLHLQTHRHGRALLKFCAHAQTLTHAPEVHTLTHFVLPFASRYLLQEQYSGKHTLVDAAIETVGVVCQLLPWQHYQAVLRYYLLKLRSTHEYQRQCVRIVVRIMDAFHFELSEAQTDVQALQQLRNVLRNDSGLLLKHQQKEHCEESRSTQDAKKSSESDRKKGNDEAGDDLVETTVREENNLETELANAAQELEEQEQAIHGSILTRSVLLSPTAAKRVLSTITTVLIPTLNRAITEQSSYDTKHKVNRKRFSAEREEEEILRVPIALALVKLMQKLPKELLETGLSGVFMKVCTFLRSPLKSVRMLTRDILRKIMITLGAQYLAMLMEYLQSLLTRGFQVHVLAVTVHGVLETLRGQLQPSHIANCLGNLMDVALNDIFGAELNAQREIDKFTAHTPEAKPSAKSYLVLHIAARNIPESCLLDLMLPFKEHLARSHSRKLTQKIQECFSKIVAGLVENPHLARESLLIFIYGTMSESISDLFPGTVRRALSDQEKEHMLRLHPDCFIIPPAPRMRSGVVQKHVKSNVQANAHILVEFGLELLHVVLKRKKFVSGAGAKYEYQPFFNPLLPLLIDALKSAHVRVTTFALKCFASIWNEEYVLPELKKQLDVVVQRLFEILRNFSSFGVSSQEDNAQLMRSAFKALVALLRKCTSYQLTEEQHDQLLLQIEQDLHENGEQKAISFTLLKALIARKVNTTALHEIMKHIGNLSVVSQSDFVRDESRNLVLAYLLEYPLRKRVEQLIKFFTVQLSYSQIAGRMSAVKLLQQVIRKFPTVMLSRSAELLYLSMGTRLVNDLEPTCRQAVAESLELLITRLEKTDRQHLFEMTLLFFEAPAYKPTVREMGAALCSRFINAEKGAFAPRLSLLLPIIVAHLTLNDPKAPGRFVKAPATVGAVVNMVDVKRSQKKWKLEKNNLLDEQEEEEQILEAKQRAVDHEIIQMQYCLLKMFDYCTQELFANEELTHTLDELAYESQKLLAHEHSWVRCNAAKILSHIIATYDFALVGRKLNKVKKEVEGNDQKTIQIDNKVKLDFIYLTPEEDIKSLTLDLCAQMVPGNTPQNMIDEMVKIFLYLANMLRDVPFSVKQEKPEKREVMEKQSNVIDRADVKINLSWLVRNICFLINKEIAKAPHCISMRSALFALMEGLLTLLSVETLQKLAPALVLTLVREMSEDDQNVDAELRQQALRVGSRMRKRIGVDLYDKMRTNAQTKLMMRRAERKKLIAQEKIHDPVRAAKRKASVQKHKKTAKKRKTDVIRGKAPDVKQKLKKRKLEENVF